MAKRKKEVQCCAIVHPQNINILLILLPFQCYFFHELYSYFTLPSQVTMNTMQSCDFLLRARSIRSSIGIDDQECWLHSRFCHSTYTCDTNTSFLSRF